MDEILKIRITADTSDLNKGSQSSINTLASLEKAISKTQLSLNAYNTSLKAFGANGGVVAQSGKQIAEALKSIQTNASSFNLKPIKIETQIDKLAMPAFPASKIVIPAEIGAIKLPQVNVPKVTVPVEAQTLVIPQPVIPKINIPVSADTDALTSKLNAASKAIKVNIETPNLKPVKVAIETPNIKPIRVPVEAGKLTIPQPVVPKINIPVSADIGSVTNKLAAVSKPVKLTIATGQSIDEVTHLRLMIADLQSKIEGKKTEIHLGVNADNAVTEIKGLEVELLRLTTRLENINPTIKVNTSVEQPKVQPVKVPVELGKVVLPPTKITPIHLPVDVNAQSIKDTLAAATKPIALKIDTDRAEANLDSVLKSVKTLQQTKIKVPIELGSYQNAVNTLKQNLSSAKLSLPPVNVPEIKNPIPADFKRRTVDASAALLNFGRIAQDAPFGILGIANNLNPALEAFQRLQKETGNTSLALKAMGAGLAGPAGIGVALSVASSLLLTFGDSLFGAGEKAKYLSDDLKNVAESAKLSQQEIQALANNLQFLNSTASLKIQIAGGNDADVLKRQIENTDLAIGKLIQSRDYLNQQATQVTTRVAIAKVDTDESKQAQEALDAINKAIQDSISEEDKLRRDQILLQLQQKNAQKRINEESIQDAEERSKKMQAAYKKEMDAYYQFLKARRPELITELSTDLTIGIKNINYDSAELKNAFDRISTIKPVDIKPRINVAPEFNADGLPKAIIDFIKKAELDAQISDALNASLQNLKIQGLVGLGEAIGSVLSGGGLDDAIKSLGSILGSAISEIGKQLITLGVVATGVQKSFAALLTNPAAMIISGVALTALGSAFKNITIPKLQYGGIIPPGYSGDRFPAMLNSGEAVIPLDQLWSRLEGFGGAGGDVRFSARLRGSDIHLSGKREERSRRRRG